METANTENIEREFGIEGLVMDREYSLSWFDSRTKKNVWVIGKGKYIGTYDGNAVFSMPSNFSSYDLKEVSVREKQFHTLGDSEIYVTGYKLELIKSGERFK
ncbi:MAG: hypothetical protein WDZ77_00580 [Candidatus Pacearchaeota archaeon]